MTKKESKAYMSSFEASLIGVVAIGLLHGLEPGHGWPIALLYSARTVRPTFYALISSGILSFFHFVSSIAVVVIYLLASSLINFTSSILRYIAFAALVLLAFKLLTGKVKDEFETQHGHFHDNAEDVEHEHEHEHPKVGRHTHVHFHPKRIFLSLWKIASCAFFLGFAHEEEFALLALAMGGVNPLFLMVAYGSAVTASLVGITILGIKMYEKVKVKINRYEKYIPKISGLVLLILAIGLIIGSP
jgi:ABC-type nickel/cobalt efflux system permease component RcnA